MSQRLFILERPTTFLEIEFVIPTDVYMNIFNLGEVVRFDALRTESDQTPPMAVISLMFSPDANYLLLPLFQD